MPTSKSGPGNRKKSPKSAAPVRKKPKPAARKASPRKVAAKPRSTKGKRPAAGRGKAASGTAARSAARRRGGPAARRASAPAAARRPAPGATPRPAATAPAAPYVSATYLRALADYEKAMAALQKRDYDRAEDLFEKLMAAHPTERDLVDRARVYVNLCRKQRETAANPQGFDDHYYQGVVLSNRGEYHEALQLFEKALRFKPDSDRVHYAMAAAHAQLRDRVRALESLRRAIAADGASRMHARQDPDFEPLRGDPEFDELVGPADRPSAE